MLNLRQYEANFVEGGFDDIDFIKDLDRNDLDMIDIKKRGHQNKLIMAVQSMAEQEFLNVLDRAVEGKVSVAGLDLFEVSWQRVPCVTTFNT